jgi:hypothetical protein
MTTGWTTGIQVFHYYFPVRDLYVAQPASGTCRDRTWTKPPTSVRAPYYLLGALLNAEDTYLPDERTSRWVASSLLRISEVTGSFPGPETGPSDGGFSSFCRVPPWLVCESVFVDDVQPKRLLYIILRRITFSLWIGRGDVETVMVCFNVSQHLDLGDKYNCVKLKSGWPVAGPDCNGIPPRPVIAVPTYQVRGFDPTVDVL